MNDEKQTPSQSPDDIPADLDGEIAKLEAEAQAAKIARYKELSARKYVPPEAARGSSYSPPSFHGLSDRLRDPRTAFEPSTQEELRRAIESRQDWYRSTTDGR